jgi:hypothetical protein
MLSAIYVKNRTENIRSRICRKVFGSFFFFFSTAVFLLLTGEINNLHTTVQAEVVPLAELIIQ